MTNTQSLSKFFKQYYDIDINANRETDALRQFFELGCGVMTHGNSVSTVIEDFIAQGGEMPGGGVEVVEELPEEGDEGILYVVPDGDEYSVYIWEDGAYKDVSAGGSSGGGSGFNDKAPENDVNFMDYDGSILYSYSADDFLNLTEMPANPSHEGLVAKGWGWTLEEAQDFVTRNGVHTLGQQYVTDNDRLRFHITLHPGTEYGMSFGLLVGGKNGKIYWGDGAVSTISFDSRGTYSHTYEEAGNYIVEIEKGSSNIIKLFEQPNTLKGLFNVTEINFPESGLSFFNDYTFRFYVNLEKYSIWYGANLNISDKAYTFQNCKSLKAAIYLIPQGKYTYNACARLERIAAASSYGSSIANANSEHAFENCNALKIGIVYNNGSQINASCFYNCYSMMAITIPTTIQELYSSCLSGAMKTKEIHIKRHQDGIVSLIDTSALGGISKACLIYVPMDLVDAYKNATNWSTYASQIVGE